MTYNYNEVTYHLSAGAAIVVFRKKDNTVRVMLCTACMRMLDKIVDNAGYVEMKLAGFDKRCSFSNKNIAAVDLIIEEPRQFNCERIISIELLGWIDTKEKLDDAVVRYKEIEERWKDFDSLTETQQAMFVDSFVRKDIAK